MRADATPVRRLSSEDSDAASLTLALGTLLGGEALTHLGRSFDADNSLAHLPADANPKQLPPTAGAPPLPLDERAKDDWGSFDTCVQFEFAEFIFKRQEMAGDSINQLAQFLATLYPPEDPFFNNHRHLYVMIDEIQQDDIPGSCSLSSTPARVPRQAKSPRG
ncbi:hypothetical protein MIND_00648900 [Mycena indigotica]|uniref:Uncharacterized protein n=1 Tax=Mycena indigotica TaxID=2126181 RepID=A0A8H6W3E4_9AGAR|nr:uncharacterized protein MIND_00648900 [Mycena indigotica]KAF7304169.1 hypothetical protein MIND_00648900 [Mycena indigotica]